MARLSYTFTTNPWCIILYIPLPFSHFVLILRLSWMTPHIPFAQKFQPAYNCNIQTNIHAFMLDSGPANLNIHEIFPCSFEFNVTIAETRLYVVQSTSKK